MAYIPDQLLPIIKLDKSFHMTWYLPLQFYSRQYQSDLATKSFIHNSDQGGEFYIGGVVFVTSKLFLILPKDHEV